MQQRPPSLLGAAAVQAADAAIVLVASVLAGVDTLAGKSYQMGSGIALTLIGLATAAALAWVAVGLSRAHRWSRTPAVLTQLFVGIVGFYLVQGHRYAWGVPTLVLACAGLALLLVPASFRALAGPPPGNGPGGGASGPAGRPVPGQKPRQAKPASPGKAAGPGKAPSSAKTPSSATTSSPAKPRPPRKRPARG
jgi:hypothetical protein